ncbi:MAG: molybdopterin-dependent oxidoreductase [Vampirovibrio sp.]|nr:molybdopterin-dependent oxidoreductase [Vampirovibrio sp.]
MFYATYQQQQTASTNPTAMAVSLMADANEPPLGNWPASFDEPFQALNSAIVAQWQLSILGQVETPLQFSYAQLKLLPQSFQVRRIVSKNGWSFRSEWSGVSFKELFQRSNPHASAKYVQITNASGSHRYFQLEDCLKSEALLTLHDGPTLLSAWHGGPVRWMSFHRWFEAGLGQVTEIALISKLPSGTTWEALDTETAIKPCKVYCYDLKLQKTIEKAGEVKTF